MLPGEAKFNVAELVTVSATQKRLQLTVDGNYNR